jgi:ATP-dependent DNA helicase RecQ
MSDLRKILIKYWGHEKFRPLQEDIINSVLSGKDTLALLPTGGGKSLCFQVPALIKEGVCLVISPLIALMKDQVENLQKRGIQAVAVNSAMNRSEIDYALDQAVFGKVKFLYISPERIETELFRERLKRMKVSLLAVDESHCISQWGYDFRPPYLRIAAVRQYLPGVPVLALTATATPLVVKDIQHKLQFVNGNVFQKSFERKNLTYLVYSEENKFERLLKIANSLKSTGVVYVRNRRKTREIAEFLQRNGVSADYYHAGLESKQREDKQNAWMSGRCKVIVSTNAFGMGIDKPDVRFVVHMDLPDTLESYFQEAGRAGRDEKKAWAVILWEKADIAELKSFNESSFPPVETIKKIYGCLGNYFKLAVGSGKDQSFEFDMQAFADQYKFPNLIVYNALRLLEKEGYLWLSDALHSPSLVHVRMNNDDLYSFQVGHKSLDGFVKLLLRSYSGLFSGFVRINEQELARRAGVKPEEVEKMLKKLHQYEVLNYIPHTDKPKITYTVERLDDKHISLSADVYSLRKKAAAERTESVIHYVTSNGKCRSQQLLAYFGECNGPRCGECDVCRQRNKVSLSEVEFDRILEQFKPQLKENPMTLPEIMMLVKGFNEKKVMDVINWLVDNGKVRVLGDGRYEWKIK